MTWTAELEGHSLTGHPHASPAGPRSAVSA
jgi:hypothetical protein